MKKILAILAAVLLAAPGAAQAAYNYTSVDYPGVTRTQFRGINDRGDVVGVAYIGGVTPIGFVYDPKTNLFTILPNAPGYDMDGIGINDLGVTVGAVVDSQGFRRGFILDDQGALTLFDHPNTLTLTEARGINNLGAVSGYARSPDFRTFGFIYDPESNAFINFLPSPQTIPHGINNLGEVVGNTRTGPGWPNNWGFLRRGNGTITLFRVNDSPTVARGINDRGQIAGNFVDSTTGITRSFVTSKSSTSAEQVSIPAADLLDYPGALQTMASGINNSGVVVGTWFDVFGYSHGFIATPAR